MSRFEITVDTVSMILSNVVRGWLVVATLQG